MTPKEKAKEMCYKFEFSCGGSHEYQVLKNAKQCALIAVIEIINSNPHSNPHSNPFNTDNHSTISFWLQVKQEIQAL